jgi:signal transduction histidine kinase
VSSAQEFLESTYTPVTIDCPNGTKGPLQAAPLARDADPRKDLFLATLAHEMRNPLSAISNALQVWRRVACDAAETEELQNLMERQIKQISRLCEDLLDVSRIAQGKLEMRKQQVELRALVNTAVETVRPFITSCDHELTVALPKLPVFIEGDDSRLIQVFVNLIHNAAKYTGRNGHIWVSAEREEDMAVVRVRDNGPGIPEHMLASIFEMFTQLDQTLDRAHGGLGIGLRLVKSLVEMHEGSVVARSKGAGHGSEFTVRLPARPTRYAA